MRIGPRRQHRKQLPPTRSYIPVQNASPVGSVFGWTVLLPSLSSGEPSVESRAHVANDSKNVLWQWPRFVKCRFGRVAPSAEGKN